MKQFIPHHDCSKTGAIPKYVSNIAYFLYEIYRENAIFTYYISILKNRTSEILKNLLMIFMCIVFISLRNKWGVTIEILRRGHLKL